MIINVHSVKNNMYWLSDIDIGFIRNIFGREAQLYEVCLE